MFAATAMGVVRNRHRYWRLNITANNGAADTYIYEIEMRGVSGGADLCTGGTAIEDGHTTTFVPARAFDDSTSTQWISAAAACWIGYDFATPVRIVEYTVTSQFTTYPPKDWTFEWSDNGTTWIAADTVTNQIDWSAAETRTFTVG